MLPNRLVEYGKIHIGVPTLGHYHLDVQFGRLILIISEGGVARIDADPQFQVLWILFILGHSIG